MPAITVRPFGERDRTWAHRLVGTDFGGAMQARLGELIDALALPGFVAEQDDERVGIVTYRPDGPDVEVVLIEATVPGVGVGTALLDAVVGAVGPVRIWLVTTNDNLDALRFYQRRGFRIVEVRPGAVADARRVLKPTIAELGHFDIPVRDEIVLERRPPG